MSEAKHPTPDDDAPIEARIDKTADWTYVVTCLPGFLLCAWAALSGFADLQPADLQGMRGDLVLVPLLRLIGPAGFQIIAGFMAFICGVYGYGAAWRLRSRTPALTASPMGIHFHPSIYPKALGWNDAVAMNITSGAPTRLTIRLRRQFWAPNSPLTGRSVQIVIRTTNWTYREAQANLRQMRRWKRSAAKA